MKLTKKIPAVVLAALMAVVAIFAGCSSTKSNNDSKTNNESTTAAAKVKVVDIELSSEEYAFGVDKKQPELKEKCNELLKEMKSNGELDEISNHYFGNGEPQGVTSAKQDKSKDQLVVATNAEFAPFEYKEGDKFFGIDMEIAKLLADELGKELVIDNMDFDAVCLSVGQHKCDIAMAGLTVNPDREASVTFSKTYYKASQRVVVKGDDTTFDDCKTADDVLKKLQSFDASVKIGYQNGTTGGMYINNESDYASNNLKVTGKGYKNGSLAIQDLINGNINYVIIDSAPADSIVKSINEVA